MPNVSLTLDLSRGERVTLKMPEPYWGDDPNPMLTVVTRYEASVSIEMTEEQRLELIHVLEGWPAIKQAYLAKRMAEVAEKEKAAAAEEAKPKRGNRPPRIDLKGAEVPF